MRRLAAVAILSFLLPLAAPGAGSPLPAAAALPAPGAPGAPGAEGPFQGLDSWHPGMGYAAPIARGFAFVEGRGVMWHSLDPVLMPTDDALGRIYQFPNCPGLRPVLGDDTPDRDSPMRQIIDVVLAACTQPVSEVDIFAIGVQHLSKRLMFVNAPVVPEPYASWPDDALYNGPPYRPRVTAWSEGQVVKFITYDMSWLPPWTATAFPGHNVDLFVLSGDLVYRPGETLLSLFNGAPLDLRPPSTAPLNPTPGTHRAYSPVWAATCIVDLADPVCGSVRGPKFAQCTTIASCTSLPGTTTAEAPWEFVNCPVLSTDLDGDGYLSETEEFRFPDLWKDTGYVLVA